MSLCVVLCLFWYPFVVILNSCVCFASLWLLCVSVVILCIFVVVFSIPVVVLCNHSIHFRRKNVRSHFILIFLLRS